MVFLYILGGLVLLFIVANIIAYIERKEQEREFDRWLNEEFGKTDTDNDSNVTFDIDIDNYQPAPKRRKATKKVSKKKTKKTPKKAI